MTSKVNESNRQQSNWSTVTTHRGWRHSVGRISCLASIPFYALGALGQGAKTVIKGIVSPVVSFGRWSTGSKKLESWSFSGVAKDAIMTGRLIDRTLNSALCVICAPPKQYFSFCEALNGARTTVLGKYHVMGKNRTAPTVGQLFFMAVNKRAQYHKQIVQCKYIHSSKLIGVVKIDGREEYVSEKMKENVKAG